MMNHGERKHSKFSASGAERWFSCPGSVALSEGIPSKDTPWSLEGTHAHEVLEKIVKGKDVSGEPAEMVRYGLHAAAHIKALLSGGSKHTELMVETRVALGFIHPEAFGTIDYAVVEHFGTLHILDYKYGKSLVSPRENLQFIFYALGVGYLYDFNFKRVRLWSLQPRVRGFDGYAFWEITVSELMAYIPKFHAAVKRVEEKPVYLEGDHCHWCAAKSKCPLKQEGRTQKAISLFKSTPIKR